MNPIQPIWGKTKKVVKFIWRHFFTLAYLHIALNTAIFHKPYWKNIFIILGVAVLIDWAKQFIKLGRNVEAPSRMSDPFNIGMPLHKRQWWNPELKGSVTNLTSTNHRIKYD